MAFALVLAAVVNLFFVPHLWRSVADDIAYLAEGVVKPVESGGFSSYMIFLGLKTLTMLLLAGFLQSNAGQMLIAERYFCGVALVARPAALQVALGVGDFVLMVVLAAMGGAVDGRDEKLGRTTMAPYPSRGLGDLFGQGGVYVNGGDGATDSVTTLAGQHAWLETAAMGTILALYWRWSWASLLALHCFVAVSVAMELVRMLFVAIHHRRTFG